jgi:hypothetical protein
MLEFFTGCSNAVNTSKAVAECLDAALANATEAPRLVVLHSTMGHNFAKLLAAARERCPDAEIVGCTGSGVISSDWVSEKMRALALLVVTGDEVAVTSEAGLTGENSREKAAACARGLSERLPDTNMIYVLSPGLAVTGDHIVEGIDSVFGSDVPLLGAAAGDNAQVKRTPVFHGDAVRDDALVLVGFADPSLEVIQGAHHGSLSIPGMEFTVTKTHANRIDELDGEPAWPAMANRLGFDLDANPGSVIAITGFGIDLDAEDKVAYDNDQILRAPFGVSEDRQSFFTVASCPVGSRIVMMRRDEDHIFDGVDRLVTRLGEQLAGRRPLLVLQADCMARGRMMFDQVNKDEIIARMQGPLGGGECPPWLGVYGFGEYCQLRGRNCFHHFTTALSLIVRSDTHDAAR